MQMASLRLDGCRVIDGTGAGPLEGGVVAIEGQRITYVGPSSGAPAQPAAQVLDVRGKTVIPGLMDLHVHSTFDADMQAYLARGITSIRFAGVNQDAVAAVK